jgi:spore coat protein U-like protein
VVHARVVVPVVLRERLVPMHLDGQRVHVHRVNRIIHFPTARVSVLMLAEQVNREGRLYIRPGGSMQRMRISQARVASLVATVGLVVGFAGDANAQQWLEVGSGGLYVSATVLPSCVVSNGTLAFGTIGAGEEDADAAVSVTCNGGGNFFYAVEEGQNYTSLNGRAMVSNWDLLSYGLYRDAARTEILGPDIFNPVALTANAAQQITIYGRVPAGPRVPGDYVDSVVVSIHF